MNIRKTITSEIEWNTIKKAQADGKLQELLQVGDDCAAPHRADHGRRTTGELGQAVAAVVHRDVR